MPLGVLVIVLSIPLWRGAVDLLDLRHNDEQLTAGYSMQ
jgi:hypothetical protein